MRSIIAPVSLEFDNDATIWGDRFSPLPDLRTALDHALTVLKMPDDLSNTVNVVNPILKPYLLIALMQEVPTDPQKVPEPVPHLLKRLLQENRKAEADFSWDILKEKYWEFISKVKDKLAKEEYYRSEIEKRRSDGDNSTPPSA